MLDFDFGDYGPYILGAFAVTAAVFGWMILDTLGLARRWRRRFEERSRK